MRRAALVGEGAPASIIVARARAALQPKKTGRDGRAAARRFGNLGRFFAIRRQLPLAGRLGCWHR
jgi:hypothetical protein